MEQTQGAVMPKRSRNQELQTEKRILQLSVFADVCFVAAELLFAFASHSQSVLMDAAYDGAEMLMMAAAVCLTPLFTDRFRRNIPSAMPRWNRYLQQ